MSLFRTRTQTVIAVQFDGTNEDEVRELLPKGDIPLPPLGHWVVRRANVVEILTPPDFVNRYEPLL